MCLFQAWCPPLTSTSGVSQDLLPSWSVESPTHLRPPTVTLLLKHFMVDISSWICIKLYWVIVLCVSVLCYISWRKVGLVRICLLLLKEAHELLLNRGQRLDSCYLNFPLRRPGWTFSRKSWFFILLGRNFGCIFLEVKEVSLSFQHSPWESPGKWLEPSLEQQNWIVGK